jgi:hypothetical protein
MKSQQHEGVIHLDAADGLRCQPDAAIRSSSL